MNVSDGYLDAAAAWLNRLPFVRWDRFVAEGDGEWLSVYGWIDRVDGRSDFVLLTFEQLGYGRSLDDPPGFTTSSAKWSAEIAQLLYGSSDDHTPCERVDEAFGGRVSNRVQARTHAA